MKHSYKAFLIIICVLFIFSCFWFGSRNISDYLIFMGVGSTIVWLYFQVLCDDDFTLKDDPKSGSETE